VEYDEERICLCGKVQGMPKVNITYSGNSVREITANFHHAVDNYLERCKEKGEAPRKPFMGVFQVRLTPEMHAQAAMAASNDDITINAFVRNAVANALKSEQY
jgi:predicted HicB family RNase H-like nuclease